jgi:hypothetical protein
MVSARREGGAADAQQSDASAIRAVPRPDVVSSLAPDDTDKRKLAVDFLVAEYGSLRSELATRHTMLYQMGVLTWAVVSGSIAAIWIVSSGQLDWLALFIIPVLTILSIVFAGETLWMAALHSAARGIEERFHEELGSTIGALGDGLYWHHRFGSRIKHFPGAKWMSYCTLALLGLSTLALSWPLYLYFRLPLSEGGGAPIPWMFAIFSGGVTLVVEMVAIGFSAYVYSTEGLPRTQRARVRGDYALDLSDGSLEETPRVANRIKE